MDKQQNCGSCRYFHNKVHTWCRRYPPVPVDKRHAMYPTVNWDNTCGEWTSDKEEFPEMAPLRER